MLFRHLHFFQFQRFLFFFNFAKGTTVSRVRFTPFPSSRSSLEGARSRGARCSQKKGGKKEKKKKKKKIGCTFWTICEIPTKFGQAVARESDAFP